MVVVRVVQLSHHRYSHHRLRGHVRCRVEGPVHEGELLKPSDC